jgi:hypothetical protein
MGNPGHQVAFPKHLVGRLIGKQGSTIQELQRRTDCRVSCGSKDGDDEFSQVSIRGPSEAKESRCARAAQLLCEGQPLEGALAQADAELEEQCRFEDSQREQQRLKEAVHRIKIQWPEFEEQDIRAALTEECFDEEKAIDLMLTGFRAPCLQMGNLQRVIDAPVPVGTRGKLGTTKKEETEVKEDYPALSCRLPQQTCAGLAWSRTSKQHPSDLTNENVFPGLPTPQQKPRKVLVSSVQKLRSSRR